MAFVNETTIPARAAPEHLGVEAVRTALKSIPHSPGVYQMRGVDGKLLYVGKAKDLFKRVTSYATARDLSTRILRMIAQIAQIDILVTRNEAEALLLEASLIKRHNPHYNILLKDDKSFPYIRIDTTHPFPRIEKHRGAQNKPGEYFGPFASVGALNETMALLQKIFLLRPCPDTIFKNRSQPCLQYQIKRCSAPCVGFADAAHYAQQITTARNFLRGQHRDIQDAMAREMNEASAAMDYEKAALLRDRIRALTHVQQEQGLRTAGLLNADVIALARRGNKSVVQVSFYRDGAPFGHQSFHPRHEADATDGEVMESFLGLFYQAHKPAPEVLVNLLPSDPAVLAEALTMRAEYKVELRQPQRGDKLTLLKNATSNAEAALTREEQQRASVAEHLRALQTLFDLPAPPERIEVYDNSHISGQSAIGAFIVATPEGFDKKSYRTFNIKNPMTIAGDDYGMMREVFLRRFKGVTSHQSPVASNKESLATGDWRLATNAPCLILIDGGKGQLSAVQAALEEIGVEGLALVAIAKGEFRNAGREWFHLPGREPFQMPINDATLHYLQRLRDEAHRFAIGRHRNKRAASFTSSALDDIPGIGGTRKRALLQHFGSRADVEGATREELEKVSGISKAIAKTIHDYFHG